MNGRRRWCAATPGRTSPRGSLLCLTRSPFFSANISSGLQQCYSVPCRARHDNTTRPEQCVLPIWMERERERVGGERGRGRGKKQEGELHMMHDMVLYDCVSIQTRLCLYTLLMNESSTIGCERAFKQQ